MTYVYIGVTFFLNEKNLEWRDSVEGGAGSPITFAYGAKFHIWGGVLPLPPGSYAYVCLYTYFHTFYKISHYKIETSSQQFNRVIHPVVSDFVTFEIIM